jgi:zinc/manganese transport system substrate-binding protein
MNIVFNFRKRRAAKAPLALLALSALAAAGCSVSRSGGATVSVVASTSVWADVARQVAGRLAGSTVSISAIVDDPAVDPHSYEVSARDELAIYRADVIVENGGGYDDFVGQMRSAAGARGTVIDAVAASGHGSSGRDVNEHVWYDLPGVARVADRIAAVLAEKDPAEAATFRANARAFRARLHGVVAREAAIARSFGGTPVAITEPLPRYLLAACGLVDHTPPEFATAIEDEQEVAVRIARQVARLFSEHRVRLLVYNEQTAGPQTSAVLTDAKRAGVPAVGMTETLPAGSSYVEWMSANVTAVQRALERGAA